jgi:hypothetical protein
MSKSKSHPCRHPESAKRPSPVAAAFWCHKCKQTIEESSREPIKVVTIMEGSPSGDVTHEN